MLIVETVRKKKLAIIDSCSDKNDFLFRLLASTDNSTTSYPIQSTDVTNWFINNASANYRTFINNVACKINQTLPTYRFCVHDTILSQSSALGQLTVQSSTDYQNIARVLSNNFYG